MITRSQMRRQLRAQGGIMNVTSRKKFGIGSYFQEAKDKVLDRTRKLIHNEIADVAVKAAPFVAPFYPGYAAIARGLGRFDQRGSISDALKQGALTYGFGKGARYLGGAEGATGGPSSYSLEGFKQGPVGKRLFKETPTLKDNVPPGIVENTPGSGEFGGGSTSSKSTSKSTRSTSPSWGRDFHGANGGIVDLL